MTDAIRRYVTLVVAVTLAGLVGAHATGWMLTPRGVAGPLMSHAEAPMAALTAAVIALAMLAVLAIVTARIVNSAVGLFVLGWGIAVMGMRSGTVVDAAFLADSSAMRIGVETLLWAVLVAFASIAIWRVGGPLEDIHHPNDRFHGMISAVRGPRGMIGLLAAVIAVPIMMTLMRTTMSGQVLGVAAVAGIAVGALGRVLAPKAQPIWLAPLAVALVGVGQIVSGGAGATDASVVTGTVPRLLRAMPIEIAGGLVAGVAMGLGWARSFAGVTDEDQAAVDESSSRGVAKPLRSARTA